MTFRFYVVSTVAFFLALAVGVVIGSALDEQLVEGLRDRVENVQENLDDTVESIDAKNAEIGDLEAYVDESAPWAVGDRAAGTEVVLVAEDGVGAGTVEALVDRLRDGGASTEGVIWLEPRWALVEEADRDGLAEVLGIAPEDPPAMRAAAWRAVAGDLGADTGADGTTTTTAPVDGTTTATAPPDGTTTSAFSSPTLVTLEAAGFVRFQTIESERADLPPPERLALVGVTGTESDLPVPGDVVVEVAGELAAAGLPAVVAEAHVPSEDGPERGELVAPVREGELAADVATVDDLELTQGRVAVVLALVDLVEGRVGHYGYGEGASSVVPPWPGP